VLSVYLRPRGLAVLAAVGLVACALVGWLGVGVELAYVLQLRQELSGEPVDGSRAATIRVTRNLAHGVKLAVIAGAAAAFLAWLYRVRVNVRALGMRRLAFARHWTWLGFLIPALNFVRPYQVMAEVWRASDPSVLDAFEWKSVDPPRLLAVWWVSFVLAAVLELVAFSLSLTTGTSTFKALVAGGAGMLADAMLAITASLAYFVVMRLSEAQQEKRALLRVHAPAS
jgi:hypothetical protein